MANTIKRESNELSLGVGLSLLALAYGALGVTGIIANANQYAASHQPAYTNSAPAHVTNSIPTNAVARSAESRLAR